MFSVEASKTTSSLALTAALELARGGAWRTPSPSPPIIDDAPVLFNKLDRLYRQFYKLHDGVRFFISGNLGNILFFWMERGLHVLLENMSKDLPVLVDEYKDSVSFFVAYLLQVISQHWLNAFLVYGMDTISTREKYLKTLSGCYTTYMGSLIGSTALNTFLIKRVELNRSVAFFSTMCAFSILNYFILKIVIRRAAESAEPQEEPPIAKKKKAPPKKESILPLDFVKDFQSLKKSK